MLLLLLILSLVFQPQICRKSDFKKLVFSENVEAEIRNLFKKQVNELNFDRTKTEGIENVAIKKLYATYLDEFRNFQLNRLQPEKV